VFPKYYNTVILPIKPAGLTPGFLHIAEFCTSVVAVGGNSEFESSHQTPKPVQALLIIYSPSRDSFCLGKPKVGLCPHSESAKSPSRKKRKQ